MLDSEDLLPDIGFNYILTRFNLKKIQKSKLKSKLLQLRKLFSKLSANSELVDEIEKISYINPVSSELLAEESQVFVFAARHYIMPGERIASATERISAELQEQLEFLRREGKLLEAQRLEARTRYDIEMLQ